MYKFFIFTTLLLSPNLANAQLKAMSDGDLADTTGQAAITIDQHSENGLDYTRVNLGLNIKTLITADKIELGRYGRNDSADPNNQADISLEHFSLGSIDENGNVQPFELHNPFFEYATDSNKNIVGMRFGMGQSRGHLIGNISSLTGNIEVFIEDDASNLTVAANNPAAQFLTILTSFLAGDAPIEAQANLVDSVGNVNQVRASQIGIPSGFELKINDIPALSQFLLAPATTILPGVDCQGGSFFSPCPTLSMRAENCKFIAGIDACFDLGLYNTLNIGKKNGSGGYNFTEGSFISVSNQKGLEWRDGSTITSVERGYFMNIPNGGITVTLEEATQGTARIRSNYVRGPNSSYYN